MKSLYGHGLDLEKMLDRRIKRLLKADKLRSSGNIYWRHKEIVYIKARLKQKGIL